MTRLYWLTGKVHHTSWTRYEQRDGRSFIVSGYTHVTVRNGRVVRCVVVPVVEMDVGP
ncbi:MAG: hypothetical protein IT538_09005 [Variibacter sp.]|nr:hypothetical protein [Variibacter sp.]